MKNKTKVLLLSLSMMMLLSTVAIAQPNKTIGTDCRTCHNIVAAAAGTQDIYAGVDGTIATSVTIAPGGTFEVNWLYEALSESNAYSTMPYLGVPTGWTAGATSGNTQADFPAPDSHVWNPVWDNPVGLTWVDNGLAAAGQTAFVFPETSGPTTVNTWRIGGAGGFAGTAWLGGSGGALDSGIGPITVAEEQAFCSSVGGTTYDSGAHTCTGTAGGAEFNLATCESTWGGTHSESGGAPASRQQICTWPIDGDLDNTMNLMGADATITAVGAVDGQTYQVYVAGVGHNGGNGGKNMAWTTITVNVSSGGGDTTKPVVTAGFAATTPVTTNVNIPITSFAATDDTAVTGYLITESATPPAAGAAGWTGTAPATYTAAAGDGTKTLYPWAKDATPNVSLAYGAPVSVVVDGTAPTTTDDAPAGWQASNPTVTLTADDGTGTGVAGTDYCIDTTDTCTPATAGVSATTTVAGSTAGTQYVRYRSTDNVGNVETTVSSGAIQVDLANPTDGTLTVTPGNTQNGLSWPGAADVGSGLNSTVTYRVYQQTGSAPACGGGTEVGAGFTATNTTDTGLANGTTYFYRVCAYDNVGNVSTGATGSGAPVAGNTPPSVPTNPAQYQSNGTTVISVGGFATATTVIFEADLTDPDGDTVKLQIDYTGDLAFDCETALVASGTANVQVSCPGLTDGNSYDWSYQAVDSLGAESGWTAFNGASPDFSVDATAPSVSSTLPINTEPAAPLNGSVTINFSENINCATVNTTNITIDSGGWTLNTCSAAQAIFDTSAQVASTLYSVSVSSAVTDPAGNALNPAPHNFTFTTSAAVNNAPTVLGSLAQYEADGSTPIAGGGNSATNSVVIEAQINDADGDVLILEVDLDLDGIPDCVSPAVTATGTPQALCSALVDGAYDWRVQAKDDQGATSGWTALGGSPDFNIVAGVDVGVDTTAPAESGLNATPGDSIIDLVWNVANDGSGSGLDPVNTYKVARSSVANPVNCDTGTLYTGNINAYSDTAVSNGTTYYYRVCAYDAIGNGSAGQTTSGTPGSSCTVNPPTVSILTASKEITTDGGFVDYTIQVTNADTGACASANLDLVLNDDNGTNFYGSLFGADPLNVAAGASVQTTIRVRAIAGQPNSSANNTFFYTLTDGTHAQSANSNPVTTTINVTGGGCVAAGDYLNTNGDQFLTERR